MAPSHAGFLVSCLAVLAACSAPPPVRAVLDPDYEAFLQACKDVTTDAVVMNLAAHPDDESARSLVFLRRKYGVRTVTVYSTCGEGGQNAIGREIGIDLARIRTRETLAAARLTGTQVRWLGFADFGYSKTAAEAFKIWGKDTYTRRLTAIVQAERPDVVLSNHSPEQGHGHHRASIIAMRELLASEAKNGWVVPVYQRASRPRPATPPKQGEPRPKLDADIKFDVGERDYITGLTYARQATRAWREHKTQGVMGAFSSARRTPDAWKMVHPAQGNGARFFSFFGSVFDDAEFQKLCEERQVDRDELAAEVDEFHKVVPPEVHLARAFALLPRLRDLRTGLAADGEAHRRLSRRIDALERVILAGHRVRISGFLDEDRLAVGSRGFVTIDVDVPEALHRKVQVVGGEEGQAARRLVRKPAVRRVRVPFGPLTAVDEAAVAPAWFRPRVALNVAGTRIEREVPVRYTPVPKVAMSWKRPVRYVPVQPNGKKIEASLEIQWNGEQELSAPLQVASNGAFQVAVKDAAVELARTAKTERKVEIQLPTKALSEEGAIVLALANGKSELKLRPVDVNAPAGLRVGLIRGPDDTLRLALDDLGIAFAELDKDTLPDADLSEFGTLVIDIRAYRTRTDLREQAQRILSFCKDGGRVVTFYHKPHEWNATKERPLLAPYALEVGRGRVCEEDAKVTLLDPKHRLWNHPNQIREGDFDGWVQERGLNFPGKWAKEWQPLMQMNDAGEEPLNGALLYAKHGKGDYVYCSLALYRQLRKGHVGSARILVNLLAK